MYGLSSEGRQPDTLDPKGLTQHHNQRNDPD